MAINQTAPLKSKKELAKELGISRSSLYYQPQLPAKDLKLKTEIEMVMNIHKAYGHKRIALALGINKKRVLLRIMRLFDLKPQRKRTKKPFKQQDAAQAPIGIPNLIKGMIIDAPDKVWVFRFHLSAILWKICLLSHLRRYFYQSRISFNKPTMMLPKFQRSNLNNNPLTIPRKITDTQSV